jgi:hypothetical protein
MLGAWPSAPLPFLTELYTGLFTNKQKKSKQSALKESKISYSCYKGHKEEVVAAGCCREGWLAVFIPVNLVSKGPHSSKEWKVLEASYRSMLRPC